MFARGDELLTRAAHGREDFDHQLFLQHAGFDSKVADYVGSDFADPTTGFVRSEDIAERFCATQKSSDIFANALLIHSIDFGSRRKNEDMIFGIPNDPVVPTPKPWSFIRYWPVALLFSFIAWFFYRRGKIIALKSKDDSIES